MSIGGMNMLGNASKRVLESDLVDGIVSALTDITIFAGADGKILGITLREKNGVFSPLYKHIGRQIDGSLTQESAEKLHRRLATLREGARSSDDHAQVWCELMHKLDGAALAAPVRYSIHWLKNEDRFLLLGIDQRPVIELQQQLVQAQIAMERDYENRRELDTRFRITMEETQDAFLFVSAATRKIADISAAAADLLGISRADAIGRDIGAELSGLTSAELIDAAASARADEPAPRLEVSARRTMQSMTLSPRLFRAAGERLLICRLDPVSKADHSSVSPLDSNLRQLYSQTVDGIVFTDANGLIQSASESFLNLVDAPTLDSVQGRSLADYLARGAIDLTVLLDHAKRAGHMRLYATRLKTDFAGQLPVEISAIWISTRERPTMGLIMRDSSRIEALRAGVGNGEANVASIMEMVGGSPLKEIVSEMTNVVEKLCIETALELTRNNRVAAAEMLGLSRQSLYVKLRKFGLLVRDEE